MPITGIDTAAETAATCSSAIARTAGPETPPLPPPSHGSRVRGWRAMPLSVLTSETASAPARSAAVATAGRIARIGRQLDDQRLLGGGAHPLECAGGLIGVRAHDQAGLDVRTGHVELDQGHLVALAHPSGEGRQLVAAEAHHRHAERHRQLGQLRQVARQEALEALVGQADRVDQPGRGLPQPRRRVALPRLAGDRLGDEAVERETARTGRRRTCGGRRSRRRCPDPFRTGPRRRTPQRSVMGTRRTSSRSASMTGPSRQTRT